MKNFPKAYRITEKKDIKLTNPPTKTVNFTCIEHRPHTRHSKYIFSFNF